MAKESHYFSHDYYARNDKKISALVRDYKSSGYGIYWCAVEMMHEDGGFLEFDDLVFGAISKDLNESEKLVKEVLEKCISKYKLFKQNEAVLQADEANEAVLHLTSSRVKKNLDFKEDKKKVKVEAGRLGGIKSGESRRLKQNEAVLQPNEPNEPNKIKLNEIKESIQTPQVANRGEAAPEPPAFFPVKNDFNGLPESTISDLIRLVGVVKKVEVENEDVLTIWEVFKNQNLNGSKPYVSKDDVYRHFINWGVKQSFRKKAKTREKPANKDPIIGIEFINDFSQCKMTDGSIRELTRNQQDTARYGQIKPNSIKQA